MNRIAVFGKPGGGKSTLSKKLSSLLGIPIYPLDLIEYKKNGEKIPIEDYKKSHSDLLDKENWIIEGLGSIDSFWLRVESADTLIYVDLPYWQHYWFTVKRLLISPFLKPEGWPEGSSIWKGTISSWRYLRLSPSFWNSNFLNKLRTKAEGKTFYHVRSISDLNALVKNLS